MEPHTINVQEILRKSYNVMLQTLLDQLDLHGPGEADHAERVSLYAVATAEHLGLPDEFLTDIRRASLLHDIGKLALDRRLLTKLGTLSDEEIMDLKSHAELGDTVLQGLPWLGDAIAMVRHHHERWDGAGYPHGQQGEAIPLGARIIAVAETFDHLAFGSYWKEPLGRDEALDVIREEIGAQFDPCVVAAFIAVEPLIQPLDIDGLIDEVPGRN